jgi:ABC-type antimicrobial peptide transport system permease subunit
VFHPACSRILILIICRYFVVEVNPVLEKHDAALVLQPASLYQSIIKKLQQLHGDFGVAAAKSGLAG